MKSVIHFTSKDNWESILAWGFLDNSSNPENSGGGMSKDLFDLIGGKTYLVGIPGFSLLSWYASGLMEYIKEYVGEVALEVPVLNTENSFVREHKDFSPEGLIKIAGLDLWKKSWKSKLSKKEYKLFKAVQVDYYNSTMPLDSYKGQYEVPEVWLSQRTPVDKIRIEEL